MVQPSHLDRLSPTFLRAHAGFAAPFQGLWQRDNQEDNLFVGLCPAALHHPLQRLRHEATRLQAHPCERHYYHSSRDSQEHTGRQRQRPLRPARGKQGGNLGQQPQGMVRGEHRRRQSGLDSQESLRPHLRRRTSFARLGVVPNGKW